MTTRRLHWGAAKHRLRKARSVFYSEKEYYSCKRINLLHKFRRYSTRVQACALHAAGGWVWSKALAARLYA